MTFSDAFLKRNELVTILQVSFGTLDFKLLYDVQSWKFIHTVRNSCADWSASRSGFVEMLDEQFREAAYILQRGNI